MAMMDSKNNIEVNRGDMLPLTFKHKDRKTGEIYKFKKDDVVRFKLMEKGNCDNVILQKDKKVEEETESVQMIIPSNDMKIGDIISKPVEYWYEVSLNPDTESTITILGFTKADGAKILTLTPEGGNKNESNQ